MLVTLTHGEKACQAVVLVQTGASLELLLGTDVLAQLGFYLLEAPHVNGHITELLRGDIWQEVEDTSSTSALRADAPVFVPDSPSAATAESPEPNYSKLPRIRRQYGMRCRLLNLVYQKIGQRKLERMLTCPRSE